MRLRLEKPACRHLPVAAEPSDAGAHSGGWVLQSLLKLSRAIDAFTTFVGRWVSWLIVIAVIISATNAVIRKVFDVSSNAYLELQWVLFSAVFLLCAPWTLLNGEHIKIDIINHGLPLKVRSWIDMIGHVFFLVPFTDQVIAFGHDAGCHEVAIGRVGFQIAQGVHDGLLAVKEVRIRE